MKERERERIRKLLQQVELAAEEALSIYEESDTVDYAFEDRLQKIGRLAEKAVGQLRRNRWSGSALLPWKSGKAAR